jgi:outer membrane receptor protein involved in Fe transport
MRAKSLVLSAGAASLLLTTAPAPAQTTAQGGGLEEVLVTARKRQESILTVPVVEAVVSRETLEQYQVSDLTDLGTLAPGLLLGLSSLEVGTQISVRGVGTTSLDPGIDQSISLNLDGLQVTQGSAYSVGVFDMEQVEILKGPQALFFGKNNPGGVVAIRTADPGDQFEIIGRVGREFEGDEWLGEAIISGPVSDTLGLRLATRYSHFGGFFENTAVANSALGAAQPPEDFGKSRSLFVRGTAVFEPTEQFSARLKLNYTRDRQDGGAGYQLVSCPDGLDNYAGIPFYSPNEDCRRNRQLNIVDMDPAAYGWLKNDGKAFTNITQKFGTLELNYDFVPELTLTSVTGYYDLETDVLQNGTLAGNTGPALVADKLFKRQEATQELRLTSDFSGPLNFTLGGFYQDGEITNDIELAGNTILGLPPRLAVGTHDVDIESYSIFGQLRYRPVPVIELAAGARWTHEERTDRPETVDLFGLMTGTPGAVVFPDLPKLSSSNWSPEFTITYLPTEHLTFFGSFKQGYKSGSYNLIVPTNPGEDNSFGDEKVRGGEIGTKARLAERQIFTNLAFYYYKYKGLQVGVNETAANGLPVIRTVNAGSAKVYGVDFDLVYAPAAVSGLNVRAAVSWNKARFTKFVDAPCYGGQTIAEGCNLVPNLSGAPNSFDPDTGEPLFTATDLSGVPLTRAPKWQANLGFDYDIPLANNRTVNVGMNGQYSSKYLTNLGDRDDFYQDDFFKLNASVALSGANDAWEVALIGNNVTNKLTTGACTNLNYPGGQVIPGSITGGVAKGPAGSDELVCTIDRGREVWLRLTVKPGAFAR